MNSGRSMDDILDSIRKIVHEEETGEAAPKRRPAATGEAHGNEERELETLVLTPEMRVDQKPTLNLSRSEQVTDEEMDAIASLRLKPGEGRDEVEREAAVSLRLNRTEAPVAEDRDEIAAFDAALAEDDTDEDESAAVESVAEDEAPSLDATVDAGEKDEYGFAVPPAENPYARLRDEAEETKPSDASAFSLRLNRIAATAEAADDAEEIDESERDATEDVIFASGPLHAPADADKEEPAAETDREAEAGDPGSRAQIERIVRSAVREELSGALGDKITRNIRGMVRNEIKRAMETRQIK